MPIKPETNTTAKATKQRNPRAVNHPAENIAAEIVGAQDMVGADPLGRFHHGGQFLFVGIMGREVGPEDADQDERQDDQPAGECLGVEPRQQTGQARRGFFQ